MDFQYDVFISKNSKDAALAQEITTFLEENGLTCFNSDTQLRQRGDTKFGKQIDDAVAHSKNLVLVCSDLNYLNSKWVEYEWTFFKDKSRHVDYEMGNLIPVMPEGVDEDELPGGLQYIQRIPIQSYQESLLDYIKPIDPLNISNTVVNTATTESSKVGRHSPASPSHRSSNKSKIVIGIVFALLIIGAVLFYALRPDSDEANTAAQTEQVQPKATESGGKSQRSENSIQKSEGQTTPKKSTTLTPTQNYEKGMTYYNNGDYSNAMTYFQKAADGRNGDAAFMLGEMYAKGQGVAVSTSKATEWYKTAARLGNKEAKRKLM
mgnify:CR=1 FL=1